MLERDAEIAVINLRKIRRRLLMAQLNSKLPRRAQDRTSIRINQARFLFCFALRQVMRMCLNARLRGVKVDADSAIPLVLERWEAEDEGTEEPAETPSPSLPFAACPLLPV